MLRNKLRTAVRHYRSSGIKGVWEHTWYKLQILAKSRNHHIDIDGCIIRLDGVEREVRPDLITRRYEVSERHLIRKHLRPNLPVIEFGGSMGVVSCVTNKLLSDPTAHVVIEANQNVIPFLNENRDKNNCSFEILNRAVAYDTETVTFRPSSNMCISSLLLEGDQPPITVQAIRLSDILQTHDFSSYNLVCDIEGIEYDLVMREMESLKKADRIILETHARFIGEEKCQQMMHQLTTHFDVLDEDGFVVVLGRKA